MDNEIHKQAFVGNKYEKLYNMKFSLLTFFFGEIYWAYRKMIVESIILMIIDLLIEVLILSLLPINISIIIYLIVSIILRILCSLAFGPLYRNFVDKSVIRIIDKDIIDSEADEITLCEKKGKPSIVFLIVVVIIYSGLFGTISGRVIANKSINYNSQNYSNIKTEDEENTETEKDDNYKTKDNENLETEDDDNSKIRYNENLEIEDDNNSTNTNESSDNENTNTINKNTKTKAVKKEYDEYSYNIFTNIDISKYIQIELPDLFENDSTEDYINEYSHKDGTKRDISFSISRVEADSAEDFIKDVTETNGLSLENDMYNTEVNGLEWYIVGFESDGKIIYYNATDYEDNVFLYRYEIDSSVQDEQLLKSYEDVIYSIKMND